MERFWDKVKITSLYGCWEWQAGLRNGDGYGAFWLNGGHTPAHRTAYELLRGPVPKELQMRHLCNNRKCVNPSHLVPGTAKENAEDRTVAGSLVGVRGEAHWNARLSVKDIEEIRELDHTQHKIAAKFGINPATVSKIKRNRLRRNG